MSERDISYTYGPVPRNDETRSIVEQAEKAFMIDHKRKWDGIVVARQRRARLRSKLEFPLMRVGRGILYARRLWIRDVFERINPIEGQDYYSPTGLDAEIEHRDDEKVVLRRDVVVTRNLQKGPILMGGWIKSIGSVDRYVYYG